MRCRCAVELATTVDARAVSIEHVRSLGLCGLHVVINGGCTPNQKTLNIQESLENRPNATEAVSMQWWKKIRNDICQQSPMLAEKFDTMHKN